MATRLTDSSAFSHLWATDGARAVFEETARLRRWLDIIVAVAEAQADLGIIPARAAEQIRAGARVEALDLDDVADQTRATSHSTLGLIRGIQAVLPEPGREYVYYGITVQDLTDTWTGLVMRDIGALVRADLSRVHRAAVRLADAHRATVMLGRTHGQPGAPITFGFKAATWADEAGRHLDRLDEAAPRWSVGQLAGAVGVLGFFDPHGPALRAELCRRLGLNDPAISWTATRDRVGEFGTTMALITSSLARIGNEVFELQRPELGEVREGGTGTSVGSITMPHKRNPEASEHLDTLARVTRANAGLLLEGLSGVHERDGRSWKTEWAALPEVALCTCTAASLAAQLVEGLEIDADRMGGNLAATNGRWASEQILAALSPVLGKHRAQALMQDALASPSAAGTPDRDGPVGPTAQGGGAVDAVLAAVERIEDPHLDVVALAARVRDSARTPLSEDHPAVRTAVAMTDAVVQAERGRA